MAGLGEITALEEIAHKFAVSSAIRFNNTSETYPELATRSLIQDLENHGRNGGLQSLRDMYMKQAAFVYYRLHSTNQPQSSSYILPNAQRHRYFIDKHNHNFFYIWLIALLFPGERNMFDSRPAKIIHCIRDGRDLGLSIFMQGFVTEFSRDLRVIGKSIVRERLLVEHWIRLFAQGRNKVGNHMKSQPVGHRDDLWNINSGRKYDEHLEKGLK